ncbi:hypothetical protein SteCoe_23173 [Stentor coeruleus]|uniref:Uncharacterized protein n=1 Tax=Stentor coeruleus TaxID=5963 RepID=A0A1R2BKH7_9CILI|nr:hypothetical protein SteCoe_24713 [Stentor coeruleus]OMJ77264.1 hypothetical protein SteCoe_23173 [Stentor coeruleus]
MLKTLKTKQKTTVKSKSKPNSTKKPGKTLDKEFSSKSTKQSTPSSNTPTNKSRVLSRQDKLNKGDPADYTSESDPDAEDIVKATDSMKEKVLDSLKVFKDVNSEYMNQNQLLHEEVDNFEEGFKTVKNEVSEILWESSKSKEELSRIRVIMETPRSKIKEDQILDLDFSSVKLPNEEALYETLKKLQDEIDEMRGKIENNEKEIQEKDLQNSELRSVVFKLRDSLMTETLVLEAEDNHIPCTGCLLF